MVEHFVDGVHDVERHVVAATVWHIVEIVFVLCGQYHFGESSPLGSENLLFHPKE